MEIKIDTKDELLKVISDLKSELSQTREIVDSYKPKDPEETKDPEELDEISQLLLD